MSLRKFHIQVRKTYGLLWKPHTQLRKTHVSLPKFHTQLWKALFITEKNDPFSNFEPAIWSAERRLRGFRIFCVFLVPISSSVY